MEVTLVAGAIVIAGVSLFWGARASVARLNALSSISAMPKYHQRWAARASWLFTKRPVDINSEEYVRVCTRWIQTLSIAVGLFALSLALLFLLRN